MDFHLLVQMPLMAKAGGLSEAVRPGSPTLCAEGGTLCIGSWPLCRGFTETPGGPPPAVWGICHHAQTSLILRLCVCALLPGILFHNKPRIF